MLAELDELGRLRRPIATLTTEVVAEPDTTPFDVPLLGTGSFSKARSAPFCVGDRGAVRGGAFVRRGR
jgi:hypothetical protein